MTFNLPFLNFNGLSSQDFGLMVAEKNSFNGAERDVEFISVPGRSGDLVLDNGRYKNITVSYKLVLINKTPYAFRTLARKIKSWLLEKPGYFKLWDSYEPEYFRLAAYSGGADIEHEFEQLGSVTLNFNCKPFLYAFKGQTALDITDKKGLYIYNSESVVAKPEIRARFELFSGQQRLTLNFRILPVLENSNIFEMIAKGSAFSMVWEKAYAVSENSFVSYSFDSESLSGTGTGELDSTYNTKLSCSSFSAPDGGLRPGVNLITWDVYANGKSRPESLKQLEIIPRWRAL